MSTHQSLPAWHEVYEAAILESDHELARGKINAAKAVLKDRLSHLNRQQTGSGAEADRLLNAIRMLDLLQRMAIAESN